jgi:DNA polymerase-3 subunit alpha
MKEFLNKNAFSIAKIDDSLINRKVKLAGIILKIKKIITKNGKQMMFLTLEDPTGKIDVTLFPSIIENSKAAIEENKIVFVLGKIDSRNGEIQVVADEIQEIIGQ